MATAPSPHKGRFVGGNARLIHDLFLFYSASFCHHAEIYNQRTQHGKDPVETKPRRRVYCSHAPATCI